MTHALEDHKGTVNIGGRAVTNLRFAHDVDGLAGKEEELAGLVDHLDKTSRAYGLKISSERNKLMTNNTNGISTDIRVDGQKLETVHSFKYLAAIVTDKGSKPEVLARTAALTKLRYIWNDRNIALGQRSDGYVCGGGNFLDTADFYGLGRCEEIIGTWLEKQPRDNFIVATKVGLDTAADKHVNGGGLSRRHITEGIEKSLKRLRTDYIDLYQTHLWDDATPIEETLRTLDDLVRSGKIRYIGVSTVTGWQLQKLVDTTEKLGLNPIVSLQQQYSLASRFSELEPFQVCKSAGIGVLPWSPLSQIPDWEIGLLTGKYKRGVKPTEGRLGWVIDNEAMENEAVPLWKRFDDKTWDVIKAAEAIAKKHGRSMAQVAIRWLLQKDVVPSVIIGARTLAQLDDNMGAANGWTLSPEEMQQLDELSKPNLPYPYEMIFQFNAGRTNPYYADVYVHSK